MNACDSLETQFYPTPPALAARAWAKFRNREFVRVLEPQAGHGDLAVSHPDYDVGVANIDGGGVAGLADGANCGL